MKLEVFRAGKGDCLLLTTADGKRMLIDGGTGPAYREHVRPALGKLTEQGQALDVVYVSHIDEDHIAGVLELLKEHVAWRYYDYQHGRGNNRVREPKRPRPPEVKDIWHNGFGELLDGDTTPIEDTVAMTAGLLQASTELEDLEKADDQRELVTSVGHGIELSRRVAADQLGIKLNRHFREKLALVRDDPQRIQLGSVELTLIGPFAEDVEKLRGEWKKWMTDMTTELGELRARMQRDSDKLASDFERLQSALELGSKVLGRRSEVTTPNLASIMFLAKEGEHTVLLTGDGHHREILNGLEHAGRLEPGGSIHVDVLKVQHHGSEHNLDAAFAKRVIADHYLFCADGLHENPDPEIVRAIAASRRDGSDARSTHEQADKPFDVYFNNAPQVLSGDPHDHMVEVERVANEEAGRSGGRMTCHFLTESSFVLDLPPA
jgi:beta-lactamase superfamily II metal-dependent hydrolase